MVSIPRIKAVKPKSSKDVAAQIAIDRATAELEIAAVPVAVAEPAVPSRLSAGISAGCLIIALALWAFGLPGIDPAKLNDIGIISILSWPVWTALALIAIGFSLTLRREFSSGPLPFLHLVALVLVLHATPAIVYQAARYSWTWKHLGIIDYIQRHGAVDPTIRFGAVYHNWPGLFAITAWIANALGIGSVELADAVRFAPPILNLLFLTALISIYRNFTGDPRLVWAAAWIFIVGNWVGQDYFSPQGVTLFLYLLVIALCLGPLRSRLEWTRNSTTRLASYAAFYVNAVSRGSGAADWQSGAMVRAAAACTVLLLILGIVASHQLTPVALILALAGLAMIGRLNIGFCIFAVVAEMFWLLYFASPFVAANLAGELEVLGQGVAKATDRLVDTSVVSPGQIWVVFIGRALTFSIGLAALLGGLRRLLAGCRDGPAIVLAISPIPMLANSYGGEILFRVYLFALPFLAFFAAALFFPSASAGRSWRSRVLFGGLGVLLAIAFLFANNGKDRQYTFTSAEVAAARWLYQSAPPGTLLIEGARSYPGQFLNYENFSYLPLTEERPEQRAQILRDPVGIFARWLGDPQWKAGYVIISRSQKAYADAQGILPRGALDRIEQALLASPRFVVAHATEDTLIFALHPTVGRMGPWAK